MIFRRLKELRRTRKAKQETVAKYLGIAQNTYSQYETGKIPLIDLHLIKLADYYETSVDYILKLTDTPIPHGAKKTDESEKLGIAFKNLRAAREDRDIRQSQAAAYLGIAQNTYSQYETGKIALSGEHLIKLAVFYGTSVDYLLDRTNTQDPYPPAQKKELNEGPD